MRVQSYQMHVSFLYGYLRSLRLADFALPLIMLPRQAQQTKRPFRTLFGEVAGSSYFPSTIMPNKELDR